MRKRCECGCGQLFEARRSTARYASPTCRQRAYRSARDAEPEAVEPPVAAVVRIDSRAPRVAPADPRSVLEAVEGDDDIATLRVLRARVAKAVDDPNCPARDLAALQRSVRELTREIRALEAAARQEAAEEVPPDAAFDTASV